MTFLHPNSIYEDTGTLVVKTRLLGTLDMEEMYNVFDSYVNLNIILIYRLDP